MQWLQDIDWRIPLLICTSFAIGYLFRLWLK
jgi:hypothetical protein